MTFSCHGYDTIIIIVDDAAVAVVEGTYSYYHYMQDGIDDKVIHSFIILQSK